MLCPSCAAENPDTHRFCDACGEPLAVHCAQCGAIGRPGARFCGRCGVQVTVLRPAAVEPAEPAPASGDGEESRETGEREYAELADRCARDQRWSEAMQYAERAGDAAAAQLAYSAATEHYACALHAAEHLQPVPARTLAGLHCKQGAMLNALAEHEQAIAHYERALALARQSGERAGEVDVLVGLAEVYHDLHRPEPAERSCEQAFALASELRDPAREAAALVSRAVCVAAWRGPIAEARSAAKAALERSEHVEDALLRSRAVIVLGSVLQWRGDFEACLPYLHEGAHGAERLRAGTLRGHALHHLGDAYRAKGRYEQALRWYADLCRYAEDADDAFWVVRAPQSVGHLHFELYDVDTAVDVCAEAEDVARRRSPWPEPRGHCLITLGLAHLARGAHAAAEERLRRAAELLPQDSWGRWRWQTALRRAQAELALAEGRLDDAWQYGSEALEVATHADARQQVANAKLVLGEIAVAQSRQPEAIQLLRSAVVLAEHLHAARELWLSSRALGLLAASMGQDRDAETHLTQAAQTVEAIATELVDPVLRAAFTGATAVADVYRQLGRRPLLP